MTEFKNPNQDPDSQKRLIIVFALTFLAIILSQQLMERFGPKPPAKPPTTEAPSVNQPAATPTAPTATGAQGASVQKTATPAGKGVATPSKQATAEAETVVENDLYRITFTNRGAQVKSWILKRHQDEKGNPLDLVHPSAAQFGYPLSLFTYDETLRKKLSEALYIPSLTGITQAPATLTFEFADGETSVTKTLKFDHNYVVEVETLVTQNGSPVTAFPAWPSGLGDQTHGPAYAGAHINWAHDDKIERKAAHEGFFLTGVTTVSNGNTIPGPFYWAGVSDQYFAAVFLPENPATTALVQFHHAIPQNPKETDPVKQKKEIFSVLGAAVGDTTGHSKVRLFVGPKRLDVLQSVHASLPAADQQAKAAGPDLVDLVDFGFFGFIAKPLFLWLKWTHDHWVANWGWSIIILTIIINLALFPLRYTSMKSALLQQKIQPELKAINYKYKDVRSLTDPRQQEKQREIQAVMKREGINPISGCIPMVLQIPFLFAFYTMLAAANELRHAKFLWLNDLSSPDPLFILPVAIVVSMFVMQKITPVSGMDPAQAKMMLYMMPLMIGAISWSLPSGLCVYWVTGNLIGFALQYAMNNTKTARDIREHLAKREARKGK